MYTERIQIFGLPKTINSIGRKHWTVKVREAKHWHHLVHLALGQRLPTKPLLKAKISCIRYSSRRPDYDGLVSTFKHVIDGLVECGVIEDDNFDVIGMPEFSWIKAKQKEGRIEVLIEEM